MAPPASDDLVRVRADLRIAGLLLLAAGAATAFLGLLAGVPDRGWLAWAGVAYLSWTAAFALLVRRRLPAAAAHAGRLPGVRGEERLSLTRGRVLWLGVLALSVAVATAGGFTDLGAGILLAAGTTAVGSARWVERLELGLGGPLYVDRRGRLRGWGPLDPRNLWIGAEEPPPDPPQALRGA